MQISDVILLTLYEEHNSVMKKIYGGGDYILSLLVASIYSFLSRVLLLLHVKVLFDIEVRDEDLLRCQRRFVSARYYNIQFGCLCSFKRGLLQSCSVAYYEVLSFDSCSTGTDFDHVMDFLLTITSRQFLVYVFRTRCSCMSIVCRGLCLLVYSTFKFHEMSSSQCYLHQDVAL
jgi:hypothetical protein